MQQFIDKLISRLEELRTCSDYGTCNHCQYRWCSMELLDADDTIKIINEFAEEYNNGWIPCSERLPEENIEVCVTIKEIDGGIYTQTSWLQEGQWVVKKTPLEPKVVAWQPLPEAYHKGE